MANVVDRFGQHLEDGVLIGLVPVVAAIVGVLLASDLVILRSPEQKTLRQITQGIMSLVLGSAVFHVIVVLFGAPVVEYVAEVVLGAVPSGLMSCVLACGCTRCC
ncbi:unnamed protein product [Phytophthora lilii]|uniref:Unnamed protein product n=1 Tax=Phytophthora lilii TaxID=2077276 RepID=A0A9W6X2W9_9STRA|nr:unnamed protein product [Phytophthora lilii]